MTTKLLKTTILVFLLSTSTVATFSQSYNPATGSLIWDLGPDDPRIRVQLGTMGINIGGDEDVAPIITNNFTDELLVKIEFSITDYCGDTKVYTMTGETLTAHERFAPDPFLRGYNFKSTCKKFGEYGPEKKRTKTRIQRINHRIITLRNLTQEKKAAEEEKIRKEKELALKRQQEEEARQKAAEARKAEETRKAEERTKAEQARKAEEVRNAEEAKRKAQAQSQQAQGSHQTQEGRTATSTTTGTSNTSGTSYQQNLAAQHQEAQRVAAEKRAADQAAQEAAEEEHNRMLFERQMAELRRKEHDRQVEVQRQKQLEQNRIQHMQHARVTQEAAMEVENLQQLNLNHSNIEQMEREYAQRLSELNVAMNNLEQAKQQEWTSAVQSKDWGTESYSQEMGEFMQTTGAMIQGMGEEKRKREARESLEWQRKQFLLKVEAEKAQMRFDLRTDMLKSFKPFAVPQTRESAPTRVYGFYVLYNYNGLSAERSEMAVSNIAEIGTYTDGTWPSRLHFEHAEAEHKQQFQYCYFHSNAYATRADAEQMRQALVGLFSKDGTVSETYIEATINPADQRMDFWETGIVPQK